VSTLDFDIRWQGARDFQLACATSMPLAGVTALYGPSGSGKTSLLECLAGIRDPQPGSHIHADGMPWLAPGTDLPTRRREIGVVFQDGRLFPHLTVNGNLAYASERRHGGPSFDRDQVVEWLDLAGLLELSPAQLSAGQRQRVAIARALLNSPRLLLLDEPIANLDRTSRQRCLACLSRVAIEANLPMLYVSHDIEEISQIADRLLMLEQGSLVEQGPLIELAGRLDTRLSHETRAAAIVLGAVLRHDESYGLTELDLEGQRLWVNRMEAQPGQIMRLRIPARDVSVSRSAPVNTSILNSFETRLVEMEETEGSRVLLRLALGQQFLLARITRKSADQLALRPGDSLHAQVKSAALLNEEATSP
jgi:molybdate transport system ATP-binding protein